LASSRFEESEMQNREQDDDVADGGYAVKPGKSVKLLAHALFLSVLEALPRPKGAAPPLT